MGWARVLAAGQVCRVRVADVRIREIRTLHVDDRVLLEAPNWTPGGDLILNGDGLLWCMPADGSDTPARIEFDGLPELNNDHVLAPDGERIYLSANDGHIYVGMLTGGAVERVTRAEDGRFHFLHGISPDGQRLAYVSVRLDQGWQNASIRTVVVDGSEDAAVTTPPGPDDGPEYSRDGAWIYLNSERFSTVPGHAQLARIRPDGTGLDPLTFDERVTWFPHFTPVGSLAVYLSFPPGTHGHPADLPMQVHVVDGDGWTELIWTIDLFGGQGTINVNSWSPDGTRFAFVDYPRG